MGHIHIRVDANFEALDYLIIIMVYMKWYRLLNNQTCLIGLNKLI